MHLSLFIKQLKPIPYAAQCATLGPKLREEPKSSPILSSVRVRCLFTHFHLEFFHMHLIFCFFFLYSLLSWNIGPAHIVSFSTEVYYWLNYGIEQIVQQYDWLVKDLQVSHFSDFFL